MMTVKELIDKLESELEDYKDSAKYCVTDYDSGYTAGAGATLIYVIGLLKGGE